MLSASAATTRSTTEVLRRFIRKLYTESPPADVPGVKKAILISGATGLIVT
jgi:hypothetical protein